MKAIVRSQSIKTVVLRKFEPVKLTVKNHVIVSLKLFSPSKRPCLLHTYLSAPLEPQAGEAWRKLV